MFCLELELFAKIKKDLVSTHSQKPGLSITQDLNKIKKKNPEHPFVDISKTETCAKCQQKILNFSRITEQTILFRSCNVLLLLHKFKLFSKYSTILSFNQKYFLLAVAIMFIHYNVIFSCERLFQFRTRRNYKT